MVKDNIRTAASFIRKLSAHASEDEAAKRQRHFSGDDEANRFLGVRMGTIFQLAKTFAGMPLDEIEQLLESPFYEVRMGGVSIMDFQARAKATPAAQRKALFGLYIRRHDRINNWDLVDRAAPHVVGRFLVDQSREVLYKLAKAKNPWERRTAIVSTYYFIRAGEVTDTFRIAEILVSDEHEYVQKAIGSWLREAGKKDPDELIRFLEKHAAVMHRPTLRTATEQLDKAVRAKFMSKD